MLGIVYADDVVGPYTLHRRPPNKCELRPHGQSADGYGRQITTDLIVRFAGGKERRVYASCFSNCASHWIIWQGQHVHLREHSQDEMLPY